MTKPLLPYALAAVLGLSSCQSSSLDFASSVRATCDVDETLKMQALGAIVHLDELRASPLEPGFQALFVVEGSEDIPPNAQLSWLVPIPEDGSSPAWAITNWTQQSNPSYWTTQVPSLPKGDVIIRIVVVEHCTWASSGDIYTSDVPYPITSLRGYRIGGNYPGLNSPPPTPLGFMAVPSSSSSILATWGDGPDEAHYQVQYRRKGTSRFAQLLLPANHTMASIEGLTAGETYEVQVVASNEVGTSRPSNLVEVELPPMPPPNQEPNAAWIEVLDWSTFDSAHALDISAFPPSISAPPGQLPTRYDAGAAVVYFDANGNGRIDGEPTATPGAPAFPYTKVAVMQMPQPWILEDSNLVDRVQGTAANFVAYAVLPATYGGRTAEQHVSLHFHFDGSRIQLVSVLAGDLLDPLGHLMVSSSVQPASPLSVSLPGGGVPGRFSGTVEASLVDAEAYSAFDAAGNPLVGILSYSSTVRIHFDTPVIER
ncbi:MAG: fibronectin type III domain-containing protein [Myxococcales bacterium]|nr:fibronectin type III domain-containing protein [Myxococcales bacterium]